MEGLHFTGTVLRAASSYTDSEKARLSAIATVLADRLLSRGYHYGFAQASLDYVRVDSLEIAPDTWGDSLAIEVEYLNKGGRS